MSYVVQTRELSKAFGKSVTVDKVNLHVMKGDIYGFIGQNGAGKTTTIRMILNLIKSSGGTVELFGEEVTDQNIYKHLKRIGAIIETPGFYPNLTGEDNLDIHRIMMDISDKSSVDRAMKLVGLSDQKGKKTRHYSLGMRQRLGIARALLHDPKLLILDEPTNGLDPQGIVEIRDMLTEIAKEGKTILISSHILAEVEKMVNRIGILHNGKLLEEISWEDFYKKCGHSIQYRVSEPGKAAELIGKSLNGADLSINKDLVILKISESDNSGKITKLLVENGIEVKESTIIKASLEDYFMKLIGGNVHA
jgi:ABC-type multidrug transport system, ATPase component